MKKIISFSCLFLFLLFFTCFSLYSQEEVDWLAISFDYLEENKPDSAEIALKNALKHRPANPLNPFLLNNLGTIQRQLGKNEEALVSYTAALGTYPQNKLFLSSRGALFAAMNQPENAIIDYSVLLDNYPNNEEALYQRGLLYLQVKNMEAAEADFQQMLQLNPDGLYPRLGMASLAKFRGDFEDAEKIYNYLIDKEPELSDLYAGRAEVYLLMGKGSKASADATKAIRIRGENPDPYLYVIRYRAKLLLHEKAGAQKDLQQAIELGYQMSKE